MKKIIWIIVAVLSCHYGFAQALKQVPQKIKNKELKQEKFYEADLFKVATSAEIAKANAPSIEGSELLKFDAGLAKTILQTQPENIIFTIPLYNGGQMELKLFRSNILASDFSVVTSGDNNKSVAYESGLHYWGIINGDFNSVAAISIFKDEIMGLVANDDGNFVLGKLDKDQDGIHIFYNDRKLPTLPTINCATREEQGSYTSLQLASNANLQTINCVRLYWEASYDIYQSKGSFAATTNYLIALFNQSAILYNNDGVTVLMSELYIWNTPSPYTGSSSFDYLNDFQNYRPFFNGDLGHMLDYNGYGGVAATIGGLCSSQDDRHCYSGINSGFLNVPTYSWSVMVVTHEQGHLMGSRHTHACVWNGNGTSIDGCGTSQGYIEGNCIQGPVPPTGGTIMSYCHLTSVGINLNYGFGPQPASVIVNEINNSSCLSSCGPVSCSIPTGLSVTGVTTNSATLSWINDPNAGAYIVEYHALGSAVWDTVMVFTNTVTLTNLTPGVTYSWQVQTLCTEGLTFFSAPSSFLTVPTSCNAPAGLSHSAITGTSANVSWQAVSGAVSYVIQYSVAGTGLWTVNTTASTTYFISGLSQTTNYEWQVQTLCAGGGSSAWSASDLFTTSAAGQSVTLVLQPDADCGKDAFISYCSSCDTTNYGLSEEIFAQGWASGSNSVITRSLLQFDLTAIPVGSVVNSAYVSLYYDPTTVNGQHTGTNNGYLLKLTGAWDEKTVTWNNQPPSTIVQNGPIPVSTLGTQDYPTLNVKNMIQYFVNNPTQNFGMMVKLANEQPYSKLIFASSDHPNPALHPKLTVNYIPPVDSCISLQYASCNGEDVMLSNCTPCGYDTINNGEVGEIDAMAWTDQGNPLNSRSLLRWDLSFIPANAVVHSASLSLYAYNSPANGEHSTLSGSNDAVLNKVTSPWNEYTVSWNSMPSVTTTNQIVIPASISPSQDYLNTDVTAMVQDMIINPSTNYGLILQLVTEQAYRKLVFASSDNSNPAKHPRLDICYTVPTSIAPVIDNAGITAVQDMKNETVMFKSKKDFLPGTAIQLYNAAGQLIFSKEQIKGSSMTISTSGIASGIYVYRIINSSVNANGKLIVY